MLELARLLAPLKGQLPRGILFMSFAGEELGLLGSAEWVKEPTRPIANAVAMINMDMIGRIKDDKVYIGGVGTGSTFKDVLAAARRRRNRNSRSNIRRRIFGERSHFVCGETIPVLFFFSGLHSDYHKPSDTWEKINAPAAGKLLDFVGDIVAAARYGRCAARVRKRWWRSIPAQRPAEVAATGRISARFRILAK